MAIIRFDPFKEMREMVRRWPEDAFEDIELRPYAEADVYETDEDIVVKMPISGVEPEDIDISVSGDIVTVKGESKEEEEEKNKKKNYYHKEVRYGAFARSFTLPATVKAEEADAKLKNGMLTLKLPKTVESKPKVIKVKAEEK